MPKMPAGLRGPIPSLECGGNDQATGLPIIHPPFNIGRKRVSNLWRLGEVLLATGLAILGDRVSNNSPQEVLNGS